MKYILEEGCEAAGLDEVEVERIAKGISRYAKQAAKLGLHVFGGSGRGTLRQHDPTGNSIIVATLDGLIDGGDGGERIDEDGVARGEGDYD